MNELIVTQDGSNSLKNTIINETYHSIYGAIQESELVFIQNGLLYCRQKNIAVLEIGFGTGLNAFLSFLAAEKHDLSVSYHTLELYPLEQAAWSALNYPDQLAKDQRNVFTWMHECPWNQKIAISSHFTFRKTLVDFSLYQPDEPLDVVFFDAFSPEKQPELWTKERFEMLAIHSNKNAILTTYCAKGMVKQALREAGYVVERLPGPRGKKHVLRAIL